MSAPSLNEGARQVRRLLERASLGQLARRVRMSKTSVIRWSRGVVPREAARERCTALGIEASAWDRAA